MNDPELTGPFQPAVLDGTPPVLPDRIGRYRVEKILGQGGFGLVYLAHDDQLQRQVAIKVPHPHRVATSDDAELYLREARTVAGLDHPHIVPVYDVGSTEQFTCFIVSKFIEGTDLAARLKESRPSVDETVLLLATVAEALHYAHKQGLVHRDIKPGNILLDSQGKPFVADFGLALREQDAGESPRYAGTPAYMSPEQARGEGHRIDGRSDIFSLGVVFYELLTGSKPFRAESRTELMEQIASYEPRPPRQHDDGIPKELERICLKALSKRAAERYTTARDLADDMRHFLNSPQRDASRESLADEPPTSAKGRGLPQSTEPLFDTTPASEDQPIKIVPKGLRTFDAHDADFFLELLPGPRDRDGLPDSIRFWKTQIEEKDADLTFSVGLIYGPSGCGKSSLMKAGLLPRLSAGVIAVYIEATAGETEIRLQNGLRKRCPALPNRSLKEMLAALRRGQGIPEGKKVVIILDQFEQWLHAKKEEQNTELVQSLRQCDGARLQCIVMVRDDFWLAVSRFLRDLEIHLLDGQNSALADLFDVDHARKVLSAFGRAFGKLPERQRELSKEQKEFLNQAVLALAQEGKVISVRLALFAEMMKGKAWTPTTLKEVGGMEGVGVTFLEETFSAATAPPEHRYHQKAARGVLQALLPESGTDIKGHMRSYAELLEASGYSARPKDFDDLIRILDRDLRLLTPTDPEGLVGLEGIEVVSRSESTPGPSTDSSSPSTPHPSPFTRYYQLTHDYLVPSLRDWLTRKQKETRRGRAELLLADRASVWNGRQENRQLPSLRQWLSIRWLTAKKNYTPPQRKMMRRAGRYHALRAFAVLALLALLSFTGYEVRGRLEARALRRSLLEANTNEVPKIVADMSSYRRWIDPLLRDAAAQAEADKDTHKQLHISLALLPVDASQKDYLYERLLKAEPGEVSVILEALAPNKDSLLENLWVVAEKTEKGKESQRLRAAAALAKYDAQSERWSNVQDTVSDDLVKLPSVYLPPWIDLLRDVHLKLLPPLVVIYGNNNREESERSNAAEILRDYAADQPQILAELVMDGDSKQFARIFPKLKDHAEESLPWLLGEIAKKPMANAKDEDKEKLGKRQANAAVAILQAQEPDKAWPVLKDILKPSKDPRARSYIIHRLAPFGVDAGAIVKRLDEEADAAILRALLQSLGEYGEQKFSLSQRKALLPKLQKIYREADDPGLHSSAEWLLRKWEQETGLKQSKEEWVKRYEGIKRLLAKEGNKAPPQWYVNGEGQTMVVIPGPIEEFVMGLPTTEADRQDDENQHKVGIGRTFALSAKSVTWKEYLRFAPKDEEDRNKNYSPSLDCPAVYINWYMAAAYCNWLSEKEDLEPCYELDKKIDPRALSAAKLKPDYLSLTGYRLPTEAEMEYATRSGTVTSRYYGETEELLPSYAWYLTSAKNRTWPVGMLKPNDWGFFDIQGNVFIWCQEHYKQYPKSGDDEIIEDTEDEQLSVVQTTGRVLRGGSFINPASYVRSAYRTFYVPTYRLNFVGFRLARTFTH